MNNKSARAFTGSITALVTPFLGDEIDTDALVKLIHRQIDAGTNGLVPVGTTGESPTLTLEEHCRVVEICVTAAAGKVPVIAGAGSNSTREAVYLARHAQEAGADGLLAVTGYYNKPSQRGIIAHFKAIDDAIKIPLIIYNVPARTASDVTVETLATLATLECVVGVKDATGDLARVARQRLACGSNFVQLSGEDITAVGFNAMGGVGCISVTSNVAPDLCAQMQNACLAGEWQRALDLQDQLAPLHDALFSDTSPGPTKYALSKMGLCAADVRLPLVGASAEARKKVDAALETLELV